MVSPLRQLLNLIIHSAEVLEAACASSGYDIPDLDAPFSSHSEAFRTDPKADEAAKVICAAALQMQAILMPPHISLFNIVCGHAKSGALRVCLESHVTEILREAGQEGLHVNQIASKNGQDAQKLARFLRYLATHHVYREVTPNVFANTRISSMLDTLKPSQDIITNPLTKHDDTNGFPALASHILDLVSKGSSYAWETLVDPVSTMSGDLKHAPLCRAYNSEEKFWDILAQDSNLSQRFNIAMKGMHVLQPADSLTKAYDWNQLPDYSIVVDVAGGIGSESLVLARQYPKLDIVLQDLAHVVEHARMIWKSNLPNARVTFEVQDFFKPQPPYRDVAVFLLKQIMHDWSDEYCIQILSHLRAAARDDTKLLVIESVIPYACLNSSSNVEDGIAGSFFHEAPKPLLANYGAVNELVYDLDFAMFVAFNAQERTIHHIRDLLGHGGWLVKEMKRHKGENTYLQLIVAVPK